MEDLLSHYALKQMTTNDAKTVDIALLVKHFFVDDFGRDVSAVVRVAVRHLVHVFVLGQTITTQLDKVLADVVVCDENVVQV